MSYIHKCLRDKKVGSKVYSLDKTELDSFMPWALSVHPLLEGGGSVLESIHLFADYEEAVKAYLYTTKQAAL